MSMFFTIAVIVLVFLIIFQIAKASEYVSVIKGEEKSRKEQNKVNGFFMITFLIAGLALFLTAAGAWFQKPVREIK